MKILDKDIPILPILQFIEFCTDGKIAHTYQHCGKMEIYTFNYAIRTDFGSDFYAHAVCNAFPKRHKTSDQTVHKTMKRLLSEGLVNGCNCGCNGEFTITETGRARIQELLNINRG